MDFAVNVESTFSPMILRRKNTWYSVADGNWSDANTWMSNKLDKKVYTSPQTGDDVFIFHNVSLDTGSGSFVKVNNLTITGKLTWINTQISLTVTGELNCTGTIDHSAAVSNSSLTIQGYYTVLSNYLFVSTSTINYSSLYGYTQSIAPVTYQNLSLTSYFLKNNGSQTFTANNTKNLNADLNVSGNLTLACILQTNGFNISVTGTTSSGGIAASNIISSQNILCVGQLSAGGGTDLTITGTASVECRGGLNCTNANLIAGTSNFNFTTNNQNINLLNRNCTINNATVTGAITITTLAANGGIFILNGTLNGTISGSTVNNDGIIQFNSNTTQMSTGTFNYMHAVTGTIYYGYAGSMTLPYTSYGGLGLVATGTKTLAGSTTLSGNLLISPGTLECSTFDLSISGTTSLNLSSALLNKSGAGNLLFVGLISANGGSVSSSWSGNPTVEFRGGWNLTNGNIGFGTGAMTFSTNNQTLIGNNVYTFNGAVTISGAINVTASFSVSGILTNLIFNNTITGTVSGSIFQNNTNTQYNPATAPMVTGQLFVNQAANIFTYSASGNQDIQVSSDATPGYYSLTLNGSGAKKLLGNVSVKHVYTLTGPATLNSNGFALTNP